MRYDNLFDVRICPVCGKEFIKRPEHVYTVRIHGHKQFVCSYSCVNDHEKSNGVVHYTNHGV